jgi:hypothetical protein
MRLLIDTSGIRFRVAGTATPRDDYKNTDRQRVTSDGRPVWTVRLTAIDMSTEQTTSENIRVEVAGAEPKLNVDELVQVHQLVFTPWVGADGKIRRGFRADAIEPVPASKLTAHAWLREHRLMRSWSVGEMARQLQRAARANNDHTVPSVAILTSYVRRWEAGKTAPTERYRLHCCTALDLPPSQFGAVRPPGQAPG